MNRVQMVKGQCVQVALEKGTSGEVPMSRENIVRVVNTLAAVFRGDLTPPIYLLGEVGDVDAGTVQVSFSKSVTADDYSSGVTIQKNGAPASISSGVRQADARVVHYAISPIAINDEVTWAYNPGTIKNNDGVPMEVVPAQQVVNRVGSQFYFHDHNASGHLATLGV
jgi:hypothetical protein